MKSITELRADWRALCFLVLIGLVCHGTNGVAQVPRVRDSVGVRIVENASRSASPIAFALAPSPLLDIGGLKANLDEELNSASAFQRIVSLSSGGYVVSDESKLRFYGVKGNETKVVGRRGRGPGEFGQIQSLCVSRGDTIVVSDPQNGRVSVFDVHGNLIREIPVRPVGTVRVPWDGCFSDGTWVTQQSLPIVGDPAIMRVRLVRQRNDGTVVSDLGVFECGVSNPFVFTPIDRLVAVRGNRMFVADTRASAVKVYDPTGKLLSIVRTADPVRRTTAAELQEVHPSTTPGGNVPKEALADYARLVSSLKPFDWPTYGQIAVDANGRLWMQDFRRARSAGPDIWTVFDSNGRTEGRISFPPSPSPTDPRTLAFGANSALVKRFDADGAAHLSEYPILRVK